MLRVALVAMMLFGLLVGTMPASAQDTATVGPKLGEPANIYDNNGEPVGTVTVTELIDPYADFDVVNSSPARGFHWVIAMVTFTSLSNALPVNLSGFTVIDSSGFSGYQGYYYQNAEEAEKYPPFTGSEVPAGGELSGAIYFQVFNGESPAIIEYSPVYEQIIVALDLREEVTKAGEPTEWTASDGSLVGKVTVVGVLDPMEDYDSSYPPQRGFRYIGVAVRFENTGTRPVQLSTYSFSVTDQEGFVVGNSGVYRTSESTASIPDLPYDAVPAGSTVTGLLTFTMINGATLNDVIFSPSSDRRIRIAHFERDAEFEAPDVVVVATAEADPACAPVIAWATEATELLAPLAPAFELVDKLSSGDTSITPGAIRDAAATFDDSADALDALEVPSEAQAASDQLSELIRNMADSMEKIADDLEAGDTEAVAADIASLYELALSITSGAYADLAIRCPGLNDI